MLHTETLIGPQLLTRLPELKAMGALIVALDVGDTVNAWVVHYHLSERDLFSETEVESTPQRPAPPAQ